MTRQRIVGLSICSSFLFLTTAAHFYHPAILLFDLLLIKPLLKVFVVFSVCNVTIHSYYLCDMQVFSQPLFFCIFVRPKNMPRRSNKCYLIQCSIIVALLVISCVSLECPCENPSFCNKLDKYPEKEVDIIFSLASNWEGGGADDGNVFF